MTESPSDSNCSETSKLSLSLSCESSSFEEELETVLEKPAVTPYQFEPYLSDSDENDLESPTQHGQDDGNSADSRLNNTDWCSCGQCVPMPSAKECICCTEVKAISDLMENDGVQCITDHQGFDPVCLNTYVLATAYNQYKQQYNNEILNAPERYRYTSYRQLVRWTWGYLVKHVRVVLPACAVNQIPSRFPSPQDAYVGFQDHD
ncbi:P2X purinoceptor 7-like [Ostrea edulis]|uniref:P2X purinoceptor 7-like n=1 Tax=Ostrea edulis TaxID=37623 RepID=UPI0024AFBF43|nr:P2X purinoceptor 7-like [Ostrea edulis]